MKKRNTILTICGMIFAVVSLVLIMAGALFINIDPLFMIISAVAAVLCFAAVALSAKKKTMGIICTVMVCVLLALSFTAGYICNPYADSFAYGFTKDSAELISQKDAEDDLKEMYAHLKKVHPLFRKSAPSETEEAYKNAVSSIPSEGISCSELRRKAEKVLSTLGDAHTVVRSNPENDRYLKEYAHMYKERKMRITEINGQTLNSFFENRKDLFSYEIESWALYNLENMLISTDGLEYLGLGTDVTFTFENENEKEIMTFTDSDFISYSEYMKINKDYYEEENSDFVSYSIFPEDDYALLTLKSCNYNDTYCSVLSSMFNEVNEKGIGTVIVDLRNNQGGNDMVASEFISYLGAPGFRSIGYDHRLGMFSFHTDAAYIETQDKSPVFKGNVYVLTSPKTFSSAMFFALYIEDNSLGKTVGMAPGNSANSFGEIVTFRLKNSGLFMSVSSKRFSRYNTSAGDYVTPDIECSSSEALDMAIADFRQK